MPLSRQLPLLLLASVALQGASCPREAEGPTTDRAWSKASTLVWLKDSRITESSGIAPSHLDPNTYYTHNDSGDKPRFFRFTTAGQVTGEFPVSGAKAVDWEDMASARFGGRSYLYLGDIGDNAGKRSSITVYRVPEPPLTAGGGSVRPDRVYTLTYPDEPHNAETLMVHPDTGDLYIVTKANTKPSQVFKMDNSKRSGRFKLRQIGTIDLPETFRYARLITAGDISPDAKHVVLRTYMGAWEYDVTGAFDDWWKATPRRIQTNLEMQGESICYSADGQSLLTTSEGSPCQVSQAKLLGS